MKVATRITVATAVVVALASAAYAYFDLRARKAERVSSLAGEAKSMAAVLRPQLEQQVSAFRYPSDEQYKQWLKTTGWTIDVVPVRATTPADMSRQAGWLRVMVDQPSRTFSEVVGDRYYYAISLVQRVARDADSEPQPVTSAMLELSKSTDVLTGDDVGRAITLIVLIVVVTTLMVGALASRFVSRPITKLLTGIDDVAKGDLSHVILAERDDEIGQIATRFNEMTFSLRESRGETQRQNEAKLALEQRLGQTEKLATIGQLAAEIAHEVGTPLNVIAGRARSMQRKSKDPEVVEKNAEIVAEQTARITRIIQRLLDFTRRKVGATGKAEINLNELSLTTMELLSGQFSAAKVRTRLERAEGLPRVAGDADRLQQVMINLMLNAVQAMPDGGSLAVETKSVRRTRPGLEGSAEQPFVAFSVKDTGIGVPEEIRDKIFDPFYTTKDGQGGTGLGLAVCSGIVKEHDGWIDVEDNDGGGTIFRVYLPA
ncbi:MAG TPA: HAMP domain-containing sensor histidine kinase [Kofleriaceae bacterium]|nr:HAMP domain-containing sensor histidine kinase [Kofleriaceae bacterium]